MFVILAANFLINAALFLDLYLIMRNPFYPRSKRETTYSIIVVLILLTHFSITVYNVDKNSGGDGLLMEFKKNAWFVDYVRYFIISIFLATLGIAVAILVKLRIQKKKSSLKRKILQRHILYLFFFFFEFCYTLLELYAIDIFRAI